MSGSRAFKRISPVVGMLVVVGAVVGGLLLFRSDRPPPEQPPAVAAAVRPDYLAAQFDPIHFRPAIDSASNEQCLKCHAEVLKPSVRERSPAGMAAKESIAWYQQTSTYQGEQDTFHRRHLESALSRQLMQLRCNTCHQGHDTRDENPESSATATRDASFRLRKVVVPETTCLKCHGQMNYQIMGLPSPWRESRTVFQDNCMACHAAIRTVRHRVNYLNAAAIEEAGTKNGETCYGCHGGRAWYRIAFPYPRNAWEGMPADVPDWAKARPTRSEERFLPRGPATNGNKS